MEVAYCYYCANPIIPLGSIQGRTLDLLETWGGWNSTNLIHDYFTENCQPLTKKQILRALTKLEQKRAVESRTDPTEMFNDTGKPIWNTSKEWRYVPPS